MQGGNQYNDHSKIVDLRLSEEEIYIKCRPLDWAKEKEFITPSYMEAWYTIENNNVHVIIGKASFGAERLENNLRADGSVAIPEALRMYMGGKTEITPTK